MKVYLSFPFEAFEVEHYTLSTSLMLDVNLLHLGTSLELVLSQFPHKCVLSGEVAWQIGHGFTLSIWKKMIVHQEWLGLTMAHHP